LGDRGSWSQFFFNQYYRGLIPLPHLKIRLICATNIIHFKCQQYLLRYYEIYLTWALVITKDNGLLWASILLMPTTYYVVPTMDAFFECWFRHIISFTRHPWYTRTSHTLIKSYQPYNSRWKLFKSNKWFTYIIVGRIVINFDVTWIHDDRPSRDDNNYLLYINQPENRLTSHTRQYAIFDLP